MKESILEHKRILAVDDERDVLDVLKEEIQSAVPGCHVDTATSYEEASRLLIAWTYDLVILDIMGVRGFDLLQSATARPYPIPTVMLTAHAFSPESFKQAVEMGARAYLPKESLGSIVPFLEDVLKYEYGHAWRRAFKLVEGLFVRQHGAYWRSPDAAFWAEFEQKIADKK